jgi:hypothetical protein
MPRTGWTPSIVPRGDDQNVYLVVDDLGRNGRIYREADVETTDLETVILDLLKGQPIDARRPSGIGITHAKRGRGILLYSIDASLDTYHLEILKAPSADEIGGRNVYSVSCFDVATG